MNKIWRIEVHQVNENGPQLGRKLKFQVLIRWQIGVMLLMKSIKVPVRTLELKKRQVICMLRKAQEQTLELKDRNSKEWAKNLMMACNHSNLLRVARFRKSWAQMIYLWIAVKKLFALHVTKINLKLTERNQWKLLK